MAEGGDKPDKPTEKEINRVLRDVQNKNDARVQEFLNRFKNIHWSEVRYGYSGETVLHCAARLGLLDTIDYLLTNFQPKAIECTDRDDKTPLHEAAQFAQAGACQRLLNHGANANALKRNDWTPLMLACTNSGDQAIETVRVLLKNGSLPNYRNKDGWTAIHIIAREGDPAIIDTLVQFGADISLQSKNGRTALHIAALHGNMECVQKLIDLEIKIDELDTCGNSALHEAVLGNHLEICKLLVANGSDFNCRNKSDYGLIHLAASEGHLSIVKYLLYDLKCNINDANKSGLTLLHCAARRGVGLCMSLQ